MLRTFAHSLVGRLLQVVVGFALVVWAVTFDMPATFVPSIVGSALAIYAIADLCVIEQIIDLWTPRRTSIARAGQVAQPSRQERHA